jgi:hypothetical protein
MGRRRGSSPTHAAPTSLSLPPAWCEPGQVLAGRAQGFLQGAVVGGFKRPGSWRRLADAVRTRYSARVAGLSPFLDLAASPKVPDHKGVARFKRARRAHRAQGAETFGSTN